MNEGRSRRPPTVRRVARSPARLLRARNGHSIIDSVANMTVVQRACGYSSEDARLIIQPMAGEEKEPTWSMGDDAPLAVLSDRPRPLSAFFRQRFAQVTNPPIDSLRERQVLRSTRSSVGAATCSPSRHAGRADPAAECRHHDSHLNASARSTPSICGRSRSRRSSQLR